MKLGKNILLITYSRKNFGDDLFLKVLCERYPEVRFYYMCPNRKLKVTIKNCCVLSFDSFLAILKMFKILVFMNFDATIILGGSMFIQNKIWKIKLLIEKLIIRKASHRFIIGANFGPFYSDRFFKSYVKFFEEFDDICFRDNESYVLFKNLSNVRVENDVVLSLKMHNLDKNNSDKVIIVPINPFVKYKERKIQEAYIKYMENAIEYYLTKEKEVQLFSFCNYQKDDEICKLLCNKFNSTKLSFYAYNNDLEEAINQFKASGLIISSRFHGLILALYFKKNCIISAYDNKTVNYIKTSIPDYNHFDTISENMKFTPDMVYKISVNEQKRLVKSANLQFLGLDIFIKN